MRQASGLWAASGLFDWPLDVGRARTLLREIMLRAPRFGGTYAAVGLDETGSRLVRLTQSTPPSLDVLRFETGTATPIDPPPQFSAGDVAKRESRSEKLRQFSTVAAGFVRGLDHPVLVKLGIVYYRPAGSATAWQTIDLADHLCRNADTLPAGPSEVADSTPATQPPPCSLDNLPGIAIADVTAGAVQVTLLDVGRDNMQVLRLRPQIWPEGDLSFSQAIPWAKVEPPATIQWKGQRFAPALSPRLQTAPEDRFAYLDFTEPSSSSQYVTPRVFVGDLSTPAGDASIWTGASSTPVEKVRSALATDIATGRPSIAFSDDGSSIVVRLGESLDAIPLDHNKLPSLNFKAPHDIGSDVAGGGTFARPPLAAVRLQGSPAWRFAWPLSGGVVVLNAAADAGRELSLFRTWAAKARSSENGHGPAAGNDTLLSGLRVGGRTYSMTFSLDGRFLTLQTQRWRGQAEEMRVWDLSPEWADTIRALRTNTLIEMACAMARIERPDGDRGSVADTSGDQFTDTEKLTWFGTSEIQACPGVSAPMHRPVSTSP
jgi:hypothetical protein